MENRGNINRCR